MHRELDLPDLAALLQDGQTIAVATQLGDFTGAAMALTREIIRLRRRGLHIVCVPGGSMQVDMLIGAGCVSTIQAGTVSLYEHGAARRWMQAQRDGSLQVKESTCPAIEAGLTASARGTPFMPVRGILGSDVLAMRRQEWKVIDNPYAKDDPILVVPAITPDYALLHAPLVDDHGNAWIGRRTSIALMLHASRGALVTYEKRHEGSLFDDPAMAAGTIPAKYITAASHQKGGSWPLNCGPDVPEDREHTARYAAMSQTSEGFERYLEELGLAGHGAARTEEAA